MRQVTPREVPIFICSEKRHYLERFVVSKGPICHDCFGPKLNKAALSEIAVMLSPFPDSAEKCKKEIRIIKTFDGPIDLKPKSPNIQAKFMLAYSGLLYIRKINCLLIDLLFYRL